MGKPTAQRQIQNIMSNIWNHVLDKEYPCMVADCREYAINSHLFMINGILNNVAENGQLMELRTRFIAALPPTENTTCHFKKVGVRQALSFPLFCNQHDTAIFSSIERGDVDYTNYKHLALYSYRTICAEMRMKEMMVEYCNRVLNSATLQSLMSEERLEYFAVHRQGLLLSIRDFKCYINSILEDITGNSQHFTFRSFSLPVKGIYAATVSSLFSNSNDLLKDDVVPQFIFQAVPLQYCTQVIMGYHNQYINPKMIEYIQRWSDAPRYRLGVLLTGLLAQVETWGMAPSLYTRLRQDKVWEFYHIFTQSISWNEQTPIDGINLFEGIF